MTRAKISVVWQGAEYYYWMVLHPSCVDLIRAARIWEKTPGEGADWADTSACVQKNFDPGSYLGVVRVAEDVFELSTLAHEAVHMAAHLLRRHLGRSRLVLGFHLEEDVADLTDFFFKELVAAYDKMKGEKNE